MSSLNEEEFDDNVEMLTKPKQKKPRSEAQIAATERMREALSKKSAPVATEKKMILKAIKDKLNGPPKNAPVEEESEEEAPTAPPVVVKKPKKEPEPVVVKKAKKEPKVIYESASESEEEVVIVKKKKKPKKKTIIYEESESEEEPEPAPKPKSRETKTQQNLRSSSVFKVTAEPTKPSGPVYYFA